MAGPVRQGGLASPCISICRMDPATGWCTGCLAGGLLGGAVGGAQVVQFLGFGSGRVANLAGAWILVNGLAVLSGGECRPGERERRDGGNAAQGKYGGVHVLLSLGKMYIDRCIVRAGLAAGSKRL